MIPILHLALAAWPNVSEVAEELFTAAEAGLRRAGCRCVTLDTTRPLGRAIRFYEAHGYHASGKVGDFFGMELFEYVKPLGSTGMEPTLNDLGQPIGFPLPGWTPPPTPPRETMEGRFCRLKPLDLDRHTADLFAADSVDTDGRSWSYLAYGPFRTLSDYRAWMGATCLGNDPLFFAIIDKVGGKAAGVASYLRITPASGSIEVGHLHYSPRLQRSPAATEAMYLMMKGAFELGYRRYEWKCDALNAASRAAAQRLGYRSRGCSGRRRCTRAATGTPPGTRPSTRSGRRCATHSRHGSPPATSTPTAGSEPDCPT
jgi:RimJ/RimL family protein N-acetyltransferase